MNKKANIKLGYVLITLFLSILLLSVSYILLGRYSLSEHSKNVNVMSVDLEEYSGVWYDVYSTENWFQRDLENVTAEYTLDGDRIIVYNKGYKDGEVKDITGHAIVFDEGRLKVSFFPLLYADYNIMFFTEDYALVGSGSKEQFWVLSRTPYLHERIIENMIEIAENNGYVR